MKNSIKLNRLTYATSMSVIKSRTPEQRGKVKPSDFVVESKIELPISRAKSGVK